MSVCLQTKWLGIGVSLQSFIKLCASRAKRCKNYVDSEELILLPWKCNYIQLWRKFSPKSFFKEQFYKNTRTRFHHILFILTPTLPFSCVRMIWWRVFIWQRNFEDKTWLSISWFDSQCFLHRNKNLILSLRFSSN